MTVTSQFSHAIIPASNKHFASTPSCQFLQIHHDLVTPWFISKLTRTRFKKTVLCLWPQLSALSPPFTDSSRHRIQIDMHALQIVTFYSVPYTLHKLTEGFTLCTLADDMSLNVSPEFLQIWAVSVLQVVGFVVMGFMGYFIKLIHIPMCVTHFSTWLFASNLLPHRNNILAFIIYTYCSQSLIFYKVEGMGCQRLSESFLYLVFASSKTSIFIVVSSAKLSASINLN